jgi:hypothetical protein
VAKERTARFQMKETSRMLRYQLLYIFSVKNPIVKSPTAAAEIESKFILAFPKAFRIKMRKRINQIRNSNPVQ